MIDKFSQFILKKYTVVLSLSILVFIVATALALNIGMDSNMEGMLPANSKSLKATNEYVKYFDSQDSVILVVEGDQGLAEAYLEKLSQRLYKDSLVINTFYKNDTEKLEDYLHLYIPTDNYRQLEGQLEDSTSSLSKFLKHRDFSSFVELFNDRFKEADISKREDLLRIFSRLIDSNYSLTEDEKEEIFTAMLFGNIDVIDANSEYIVSDSQQIYLMIIRPNIDMEDFIVGREVFFNGLTQAIEETNIYSLRVGITGGAFVQDYEADSVMLDGFLSTAILTFALIILFIVISFKRLLLPISAGYPLLLGAILSTAFAYLMYKNLNLFSISFAVLLLGLGIDFAVHIISRYLEERGINHDINVAVENTIKGTGGGIIVGAITTALAFLTFLAAEFKAFTQMGVISGIGILLLALTMLLIVPCIIILIDSNKAAEKNIRKSEYAFLKPLGKLIEAKPLLIVVIALVLAIGLSKNVMGANIKTDISKLYPENMESLQWLKVVEEEFDFNPTTLTFMVDSLHQLRTSVSELLKRDDIQSIDSILEYLPKDEDYKLNIIGKLNTELEKEALYRPISPSDVIYQLEAIRITAQNSSIDESSEGYIAIGRLLDALSGPNSSYIIAKLAGGDNDLAISEINQLQLKTEGVSLHSLPDGLMANYLGRSGKISVEVVPRINIWETENYNTIAQAIEEVSGYSPIGMPSIMNELIEYVEKDILRISIFCLLAIFIILLLMFRSIKDTIITIIPLSLTIYITLGIMPILGAELNIFSIVAFPVLIGIGIDSAVHLNHRLKSSPDKDIAYILAHTGKAIAMTTITTLIGFGSLYFTHHPGLSSFGLITIIGMSLCLILTLTVLPSLYLLLNKKIAPKN